MPAVCFGTDMPFRDVDMLTALLNSWSNLAKLRPAMMQLLVPTLKGWTPAALANLSAFQVKSVEKGVRILLANISRYVSCATRHPFHPDLLEGYREVVNSDLKSTKRFSSRLSVWSARRSRKRSGEQLLPLGLPTLENGPQPHLQKPPTQSVQSWRTIPQQVLLRLQLRFYPLSTSHLYHQH